MTTQEELTVLQEDVHGRLPVTADASGRTFLPPILEGYSTLSVEEKVRRFVLDLSEMLERWISRRSSPHTQRAYRQDLFTFIRFAGLRWPEDSAALFAITVGQVHSYRDWMTAQGDAPKTINRRIASLSGFFKFLREVAAELRLPIQVANPADKEFVARDNADPARERQHFSAAKARQLFSLPAGETILDYRDRALLKVLLYAGVRIGTLLRLEVEDFHGDSDDPTLRITEKGSRRRTIGLNVLAAQAVREYIEKAALTHGPLFRARLNSRSQNLGAEGMSYPTAYRLLQGYFAQLPGALKQVAVDGGEIRQRSVYTPHSTRATTATLLLEAGEDIRKVQELLGHRHVTTTQIYDKRRRQTSEGASHHVPI
jgi:site-specific recombinase XerD